MPGDVLSVFYGDPDTLDADTNPDLPPDAAVELRAARMISDQTSVVGVSVRDGQLSVAWGRRPTLAEEASLTRKVGMPVVSYRVDPVRFAALHRDALRLISQASEAPQIEQYLDHAIDSDASDLHLRVGSPPHLRVAGRLHPIPQMDVLSSGDMDGIVAYLLGREPEPGVCDYDCAVGWRNSRFRVNLYRQRSGWGAVLRLIPSRVPGIEELGLPDTIAKLAGRTQGIIIVSGVTGSGKSTTLASMIDLINQTRRDNIITLEDPVEYIHTNRKSLISQREVGEDTGGFASGLRAALREDPDVILVGEMRDFETIEAAIRAAETGHLVLSTLHAGTTQQAIDRIIDVYPPSQQQQIRVQLASTLVSIICQKLVVSSQPGKRYPATEIFLVDDAGRSSILNPENNSIGLGLQSRRGGMRLMDHSLAELVASGKVDFDEARRLSSRPDTFVREVTDAKSLPRAGGAL